MRIRIRKLEDGSRAFLVDKLRSSVPLPAVYEHVTGPDRRERLTELVLEAAAKQDRDRLPR